MVDRNDPESAVAWLRTPGAVRSRCRRILAAARTGELEHFALRPDRIEAAAEYVARTIRDTYPGLEIPCHSRWRHFTAGGIDRWGGLAARLTREGGDEIARIRFDLAVTSVLLDAGAGATWHYREPDTGVLFGRSEGLAVASFHLFAGGALSDRRGAPLRADAGGLEATSGPRLATAFQSNPDNPLLGLDGRASLLRRLAGALRAAPKMFGASAPRVGNLYDYLAGMARRGCLPASVILTAILAGLGPVWPGRLNLGGADLGDVWSHPVAACDDLTDGLVPFHKLPQWLTYSLVEPLEEAGIRVTGLDELTGLAEYRNGGLLVDLGVLSPKHEGVTRLAHPVDSTLVVEWRALTVALLDELAGPIRARLGRDRTALPLAKLLEGGTWRAGRRIAAERRADGAPPIRVVSDGTVF